MGVEVMMGKRDEEEVERERSGGGEDGEREESFVCSSSLVVWRKGKSGRVSKKRMRPKVETLAGGSDVEARRIGGGVLMK